MKWKRIKEFPAYKVSDTGLVQSVKSERILAPSENQSGLVQIGLVHDGVQYHRSVPLLVAKAFLPQKSMQFDTPINLDGDRYNNNVWNLAWRPRWFAVKYNRQFRHPYYNPINALIEDLGTGEVDNNSFECAIRYGLLEEDLVISILNRGYVWPTYQQFRIYRE